jgi:tetratricopeptide (TPR) repeat protein
MATPQPSVFISYRRRTSSFIARAVFMDLRQHGYDVFMDVESIDSGQFETIILDQIAARAHFVVILTQGSLDGCQAPDDWLRREIERAIDLGRNIVPLLVNEFRFDATASAYLTGRLTALPSYNALTLPHEYFDEAMARLRTRFLREPAQGVIKPAPRQDASAVQQKIEEVANQSTPTQQELSAEDYFNRGYALNDNSDEEIAYYTEAIRLNPQHVVAYYNRGVARRAQGDLAGAIADYTEAIRLNPQNVDAYYNQGNARRAQGDQAGAIADYSEAIRLDPQYVSAYYSRGNARRAQGDQMGAIADYTEALRLDPQYVNAYYNRGVARSGQGDPTGAIADYEQYLALGGGIRDGDQEEVQQRIHDLREQLRGK